MIIGTVIIRSPEFGDSQHHEATPTTRIVGTTVKTVRRETPHGYIHNYTVRGLCLEDRIALINEIVTNLGTIVIVTHPECSCGQESHTPECRIEEKEAIIHDDITISEDTTGYSVSFTVEYVIDNDN